MDLGKAVFAGFAMIALGILAAGYSHRVDAESSEGGYSIATGSAQAWAIDPSGRIVYCTVESGVPQCRKVVTVSP